MTLYNADCPQAGIILDTGANSTRAKATMDWPYVDIAYDDGSGSFVPVEQVSCNKIFDTGI